VITGRRRPAVAVAGLALVVAGSVLLYTGEASKAPRYWERADATIIGSEVKQSGTRPYAEIRFEYQVYGRKVLGRQLQFGPGPPGDIAAAFPVGKSVEVRYDPAQPEHSMLITGGGPSWRRGIAAVLMGAGVAIALWGMRRRAA
jgi:hypothetical protein